MPNPFRSRRVRDLPPEPEPTAFEVVGGWGAAREAAGALQTLDPVESERAQRVAGAVALADLYRRDAERNAEQMAERLRGVQRGHDYGRPI